MSDRTQEHESKFVPVEKSLLNVSDEKRRVALERCASYKESINEYLAARDAIPAGLKRGAQNRENRTRVLKIMGGTEEDWHDWKWHIRNVIQDVDVLGEIVNLTEKEKQDMHKVEKENRWAISPYYASLMDPEDRNCPVRLQSLPSILEMMDKTVEKDPETVQYNSPAPLITRLYPDRLIINITNACAMFCRHCLRRRHISHENMIYSREDISKALDYIRENREIRDVLITGGDAFSVSDELLDWILTELDNIPHVELKRLGTRMLCVLPMRVTDDLCDMLATHSPLYLNTQFNHSKEVTEEAKIAADKLTRAGILIGNQSVLLRKINNTPHVMKKLCHELLKIKIRPYYIFNCKKLEGINHFRPTIEDGLNIMEHLRNFTSGLAVPTYICTLPDGRGKTPVMPNYLCNINADGKARFRSWQGHVIDYDDEKRDFDYNEKPEETVE